MPPTLKDDPAGVLLIVISIVLGAAHVWNRRSTPDISHSTGKAIVPPMITTWIPWIGGVVDYMAHPLTFFKKYSNQHNSVFKFKVLGQPVVAISSPTAVSNVFRDRSGAFDVFDGQKVHVLSGIDASKDRASYLYSVLGQKAAPPLHRAMMPSRLPSISSRLTEQLLKVLKQLDLTKEFSLNDFVQRTLYTSSSIALYGPDFPIDTYEDVLIYDDGAGLHVRHLGLFATASTVAREAVFARWTKYLIDNWVPEKGGHLVGSTDMMSEVYRGLKQADLSHDELHRLMCLILWSVHTNVMQLTTWVMCHILTDNDVYTRVCQEIRSFVTRHYPRIDDITQLDPRDLDDDAFRFLNSVVQEVMRTKTVMGPLRVATRDTVIMDEGEKFIVIEKGDLVAINLQGMHHSPSFQDDPGVFKADRYVNGAPYRSYTFGCGKHSCAGRNYARFSVRQFVILALAKYDIRVQGRASLPEAYSDMGLDIVAYPRRRSDLTITLRRVSESAPVAELAK